MWGQRNSKYAATMGVQLLAKIHKLQSSIEDVDCKQNHPLDCLDEHVDFMGEASDKLVRFIDELNHHIDIQDIQIEQLANTVNELIGKVEGQAKEIKMLKENREEHCQVINILTAKVIALEECVEDVQKRLSPGRRRATWSASSY
jgi:uncharacterized coiled-coil DUF342 family protein